MYRVSVCNRMIIGVVEIIMIINNRENISSFDFRPLQFTEQVCVYYSFIFE